MARSVQFNLPGMKEFTGTVHGGEHGIGKRKGARPIAVKRPMHLVMRASAAKGQWSFLAKRNAPFIETAIRLLAKRFHVRIYRFANSGNHLHLLVQAQDRRGSQSFLRVLPGRIAQFVTGARKSIALSRRFWDLPIFSRIVEWGRAFHIASAYVIQNELETIGVIPYQPRKRKPKPRLTGSGHLLILTRRRRTFGRFS